MGLWRLTNGCDAARANQLTGTSRTFVAFEAGAVIAYYALVSSAILPSALLTHAVMRRSSVQAIVCFALQRALVARRK